MNGEYTNKNNTPVRFPVMGLDLSPFVVNHFDPQLSTTYNLYAVCCHKGTMKEGHYTAICKNPILNTWIKFNDSLSKKIQTTRDFEYAYMLFYRLSGR